MTDMGLDGLFLMSTISLGIVWLMIVVFCIGRLRADPVYWVMLVGTIIVGVVIFSQIGEEHSRVSSVSGTVTEVSDVLWDNDGEPFTEVKLDSIDHSVRMMGNAGVKELVGKEKTFTCSYKGKTTEDEPIYVCK